MEVKVCKFGGTSLANSDNIRKVFNIIHADPKRRIIVVSAPGKRNPSDIKITDLLFEIYNLKEAGKSFKKQFDEFAKRFFDIEREFNIKTDLKEIMQEFHDELGGKNSDFITSTGEYFMAKIMAAILGFEFLDLDKTRVISLNNKGEVDIELSHKNFEPYKNKKVVIPGFYGHLPDGTVKTFPRGGSDITGAIIANIADADLYENWTDVDGVYDKDPNKFPEAKKFDYISYDQVEALAHAGANVLNPDCIEFVRVKNIPINLKNTFNPANAGTMIKKMKAIDFLM